jgi:hypothetical protein
MIRSSWRTALLVLTGASAAAAPALAHHSFAMFDTQRSVTVEGTVKAFQWSNPHASVQIIVKDQNGRDVEWSVEGGSPNGLARQGWSRQSLKPGDKASVVIHPLKDGANGGVLVRATVNGKPVGAPG